MTRFQRINCVVAVLMAHALCSSVSATGQTPDGPAQGLDTTITEVTTTGSWEANGRKGVYRAIIVMSGNSQSPVAQAYVQWLSPKADGTGFEMIVSKPIQAFNDRKVDNAELTMDSEKINEGTLVVQSYDPAKDTDQGVTVKLGGPGEMTIDEQPPTE
jgi:hypothetical protein